MAEGVLRTVNFGWGGLVIAMSKAAAELNKDIQKENSPNFEKKPKGNLSVKKLQKC